MRAAIAALSFIVACATASASDCVPMRTGQDVQMGGTLEYKVFPGRPNYESIAKGDERETAILLKLPAPVCVEGLGIGDLPFKAENITLVQLAILPSQQRNLYPGKRVRVVGELYDRHTGHHHAEVLMSVREVR